MGDRARFWRQTLPGVLVIVYSVVAALTMGVRSAISVSGFYSLVILCIWYPRDVADIVGSALTWGFRSSTRTCPHALVSLVGWCLLLLPLFVTPLMLFVTRP